MVEPKPLSPGRNTSLSRTKHVIVQVLAVTQFAEHAILQVLTAEIGVYNVHKRVLDQMRQGRNLHKRVLGQNLAWNWPGQGEAGCGEVGRINFLGAGMTSSFREIKPSIKPGANQPQLKTQSGNQNSDHHGDHGDHGDRGNSLVPGWL